MAKRIGGGKGVSGLAPTAGSGRGSGGPRSGEREANPNTRITRHQARVEAAKGWLHYVEEAKKLQNVVDGENRKLQIDNLLGKDDTKAACVAVVESVMDGSKVAMRLGSGKGVEDVSRCVNDALLIALGFVQADHLTRMYAEGLISGIQAGAACIVNAEDCSRQRRDELGAMTVRFMEQWEKDQAGQKKTRGVEDQGARGVVNVEQGGLGVDPAMQADFVVDDKMEIDDDAMRASKRDRAGGEINSGGGGGKRMRVDEQWGHYKVPVLENGKKCPYFLIRRWISRFMQRTTSKIAGRFCSSDGPRSLTEIEARKITFAELSDDLRRHEVIETGGDFLLRIIQLCNWGRKHKPLITGTVNAKIYLAAYMIVANPNNVFDAIGDLETKVIEASRPLVDAFHGVADLLKDGVSWKKIPLAREIPALLCSYLRSFKNWKIADERKLSGRLRRALEGIQKEIDRTLQSRSDGSCSSDAQFIRDIRELGNQKDKLEAKLKQIGRVGEAPPAQDDDYTRLARGSGSTAATVVKTHNVQDLNTQGGGNVGSGGMNNEQLAHELILDGNFRLDEKAGMSDEKLVHTKIRETFERAFWDSLVEDLTCSPPNFAPVLNVLSEIRTGIESLMKNQPEARQIREIIDVEHIKIQLMENSLDFKGCERLIDSIIGVVLNVHDRMRATARRDETLSKWKKCQAEMQEANGKEQDDRARAICKALELVLDRIHKIRVDIANGKLRAIAPTIRQHGIEYAKTCFAKKLASGAITMKFTDKWIRHTVEQLLRGEKSSVVDLSVIKPDSVPANLSALYEATVRNGIVDLVVEYPNWGGEKRGRGREDEIPETLMLDLLRVKALNVHFHTDVVSSVILTQVDQEIRNRVHDKSTRAKLLKNVADILKHNPPKPLKPQACIDQVVAEISPHLDVQGRDITRKLIEKHVQKTHPVYAHMAKQFKLAWYHKLAGAPDSLKVPESARCMQAETLKHAQWLSDVAKVNLSVHTERYNKILNGIFKIVDAQQQQKGEPAAAAAAAAAATDALDTAMDGADGAAGGAGGAGGESGAGAAGGAAGQ